MQNQSVRIVVVDDHTPFRDAVVETIEQVPEFCVVGQGASAQEAIQASMRLQPEIIVLDLDMPGGGIYAIQTILSEAPSSCIVVLTASEDEGDFLAALRAGAQGYILKGVSARQLITILRSVIKGVRYVPAPFQALLDL